ncbi:MAG TPA: amidase [Candidatus Dormibacteraeota bacterium]|nr:amidase [Candidatus Dormibacteraeota bacterium]
MSTIDRAEADLWRLSAMELAAVIRSREVSSREVVEAHLRRIEAVNPQVNAIPVVLAEAALETAKTADRRVVGDVALPPLHGVPFTVKSNLDLAGTPTTHGLRAMAGAYPKLDAPAVERLKAAGAIPIGRSNMPDFAIGWHTQSQLYGATLNPWDRSRTPGGSTGGEGVALATGMSPLGLGNDTLGSLRWPAQCSGIAALKPTLGRVPDATSLDPPLIVPVGLQLAAVNGPLARRVADLRAALHVLAGPTWRDPWSVPAPLLGPPPRRPIRVAVVLDPAGRGTARQVRDGVRKAAGALADAGYAVEEVEPPSIETAARCVLDMLDLQAGWNLFPLPVGDDAKRWLAVFFEVLGEPEPLANALSFVTRHALLRAWGEFQETYPLILAPVGTDLPFRVGADRTPAGVADNLRVMRMVMAVNALGLPAVAVPVGVGEGLPQVVQLIGPRYCEDLCLDAAEVLEERYGTVTPIDPR